MRDKLIAALEEEIGQLNRSYNLAMNHATNLLKSYEGRQVSSHLAHNLAYCAADLAGLAAKIEQTHSILAYVREQTENGPKS